jgi:hypothetical protein
VKVGDAWLRPAPLPTLLHALQPAAKLIVTLAEPVRRMYSDYYFLTADRFLKKGRRRDDEMTI